LLAGLLGEQALKRVLQVPFALVQLGGGPALLDRPQHPAMGIANDPLRLARQRAQEGAPIGGVSAREGLGPPEPWLAGAVADRAEDVESDPPGRDSPPAGIQGPHPEGQMVEQKGALTRPGGRAMLLKNDVNAELLRNVMKEGLPGAD
jgi:hypothetical protein